MKEAPRQDQEDRIKAAFAATPRANFMPADALDDADEDEAEPIGYGQTISQPSTVWQMLEWLDVQPAQKVLDVGSGSGWTTALLSRLVGSSGHVYALEMIPALLRFGEANCKRLGITNATFHLAGSTPGLPQWGPYDRILVSAAADEMPPELIGQLKRTGKIVIPIRHEIWEVTKATGGELIISQHSGYVFVPLVRSA